MSLSGKTTPDRIVACPQCGGDSRYGASNTYRPFCSARCKGIDLGAWADEGFRLAVDPGDVQQSGPPASLLQ